MTRRPLYHRRRRFSLLRLLCWLVLLPCAVWAGGFALYLLGVETAGPPNPMPRADGIVALTGGDDRIAAALALLAQHDAPRLLISGVGRGTYLGDFTPDDVSATTRYASDITLGHMAGTTYGNALEAADWVHNHHLRTLIIVTADYHMPRAMLEMRRHLPGITLIPAPVRPPAMDDLFSRSTIRLLTREYTKYLVVRFGLRPVAVNFIKLD
jgi:uncharacterized SAM-binding protein YcdF (DUF218 family)